MSGKVDCRHGKAKNSEAKMAWIQIPSLPPSVRPPDKLLNLTSLSLLIYKMRGLYPLTRLL